MELTHKQIQDVIYEWLKLVMEKKEAIDISNGQEERINMSRSDFNAAVRRLSKEPGYVVTSFGKVGEKPVRVLYRSVSAKATFPKVERIGILSVNAYKRMLAKKKKEKEN